jgi:NADH-quinone oxidoreductase subunit E
MTEYDKTDEDFGRQSRSVPNPSSARVLDAELRKQIAELLPKYPTKQAVTLPALHRINDRLGYVPIAAVVELAELLELAPAQVQDTLSFYGFFKQEKPRPKFRLTVCQSITCAARGSEGLLQHLCEKLHVQPGETTLDGRMMVETAECLGACDTAPSIMVNDTLHGNMTKEKLEEVLFTPLARSLERGRG